jgi:hypothetical protein
MAMSSLGLGRVKGKRTADAAAYALNMPAFIVLKTYYTYITYLM